MMIHQDFILFITSDYIDKINYFVLSLVNLKIYGFVHFSTTVVEVRATHHNYYTQNGALSHLPHI